MSQTKRVLAGLVAGIAVGILLAWRDAPLALQVADIVEPFGKLWLNALQMTVVPLVLSTGAGAEMRRAMGVAVFSGMLGVTFFGLLLTPVFYLLVRRRRARASALQLPNESAAAPAAAH